MADRLPLATPGSWVELRDPADLRAGDKRRVLRMLSDSEGAAGQALSMIDGIMAVAVVNWQLPEPLPVPGQDITVLDRMTIADYDKLADILDPVQEALFPTAPAPTAEQQADELSPTEPSAG